MANNNTPTHDFAPAWLKIPSYETSRPLGSDIECERYFSTQEHRSYRRHHRDSESPRHHSSGREREGKRKSYNQPCHDNVDSDDDSQHFYNTRWFDPGSSLAQSIHSQSSVLCRTCSRHVLRDLSCHSKYRFLYRGGFTEEYGSAKTNNKHSTVSSSTSSESINRKRKEVPGINFQQEFPSLHGEASDISSSQPLQVNGGVWKNPVNAKVHGTILTKNIHLIQRPVKSELGTEMRNKSLSGVNSSLGITASSQEPSSASVASRSRYFLPKAIVPAKQNSSTKKPVRESVLLSSKEIMTNGFEIAGLNSATSLSQPLLNSSSRHHMEILIKNPKVRGNKSEFLKTLQTNTCSMNEVYEKGENHHNRHGGNKTEDEEELFELHKRENYVNGINIEKMSVKDDEESEDINMLSSSLEAEERLLREMGWKEECLDDDNYAPLTEEELKEFHSLTQKLQMNEGKNGIQRNFHRSWSPGHIPQFKNVLSVETNWSSSSDTDSD